MVPLVDLLRLFAGAAVLAFAAYTDWQWRRAPNVLWIMLALVGAVLLAVEAALDWSAFAARWPYLVFIPGFAIVVYGLWYFGLIAGGADAKALMALGVLLPFPIALAEGVPPLASPMPGAFSVLANSLLAFMLVPLGFLVWNLAHGDLRFPMIVLGVRRRARDVRRGHVWPMELVDETGARRARLFASRMSDSDIDEAFARVQALGDERVWVSPKIPFMIPLLAGFLLAFGAGDLLMGALTTLLPQP